MKKGIIVTLGLLLAVVLLTASITGCSDNSPADSPLPPDGPAETSPPAVAPPAPAAPSEVNVSLNTQTEGIWVSGTGRIAVNPDIAILRLGIEAQEVSVAEAQDSSSAAMEKVMTALSDSGVEEKDVQTQDFRIRQRTRWDDEQQQEVVIGYRVTNDVVAKIRDMEKIGDIIDAVVAAGGDYTRIDDLNFSVEDPSAYYDEAREKAIDDAKGRAEKIADLAGVKLGDPTYINESASTPYLGGGMGYEMAAPTPAPAPTIIVQTALPISLGEVEITVNIQVAYGITKVVLSSSSYYVPPTSEGKVYIEGDNKPE